MRAMIAKANGQNYLPIGLLDNSSSPEPSSENLNAVLTNLFVQDKFRSVFLRGPILVKRFFVA
jgi:hypothetical protein